MKKILIVDDEEIIRKVLERLFKKNSFDVTCAENGKIALEKIQMNKYDLVILDILMPELNGIQFLKELQKLKIKTKIIVISACHDNALINQTKELGARMYIKKPFNDINQVLNLVNEVI